MNKDEINRYKMLAFALICLIILLLTSLSLIPVSQWLGQDEIIKYINNYLNESQKISRQNIILLFELKALLAPIQHSNVGISFIVDIQVGVGDILASSNELISDTIKIDILAISTIEVIKYVIIVSETIIPWLFTALLIAGAIFGLCHSFSNSYGLHIALCNKITKVIVVFFFVLHILLPYSLFSAALLSKSILDSDKTENRVMLHHLHDEINATHIKGTFKQRAENSMNSFEKVILDLPHKIELMVMYHTKHMAMSAFEFIILPIVIFIGAVGILRWIIKIEDKR